MDNFDGIKNFSPDDHNHWGDSTKLNPDLLQKLDRLRDLVGCDILITSGWRPNDPGQHGKGNALDLICHDYAGRLRDFYDAAVSIGFTGIGVYPNWQYNGARIGGIHVDVRSDQARWIGLGNNRSQQYVAFTEENLRKYGVV